MGSQGSAGSGKPEELPPVLLETAARLRLAVATAEGEEPTDEADAEWKILPDTMLEPWHWTRVVVGTWRDRSHINEKQASIALAGLKRSAGSASHHQTVVLSLGDNMFELLSFESGRAKSRSLNVLNRVAAALQITTGISWRRRHCETARNPSDAGSRLATQGLLRPGQTFFRRSSFEEWRGELVHPAVCVAPCFEDASCFKS